jgi:integrase
MESVLDGYLRDYLQLRHVFGHTLSGQEQLIASFLTNLEATGDLVITIEAALAWACASIRTSPCSRAARLSVIRGFANYVHGQDPSLAQIIPQALIPARVLRGLPYIYSQSQITALMEAALLLGPRLRGLTLHNVIGLMAATGMRISECVALNKTDMDLTAGILSVTGKRGHRRLVPLHPTTTAALSGYLRSSRTLAISSETEAFFLNFTGARAHPCGIERAFRQVSIILGYGPRPGGKAPRLHDLRHTFATNALVQAHRDGVEVDRRVAVLATYLGHVSPASTYWYLSATPELLELSAKKVYAAQQGGELLS